MVSGTMDYRNVDRLKGTMCQRLMFLIIWLSTFGDLATLKVLAELNHLMPHNEPAQSPSMELFEPLQISPSAVPNYPLPNGNLPPLYPSFPNAYQPVLTEKCPVNFSALSTLMERSAADCSRVLAPFVANVICCPQIDSLLHIFQGYYSTGSDKLVLQEDVADDCFSDIFSILASNKANNMIPTLCSVKASNLTGGSCPVKDLNSFEKLVNTGHLLDACSTVDPLKECCKSVCQPAVADAAFNLSAGQMTSNASENIIRGANDIDALNDCKSVVYSWLSRKLSEHDANTAFRMLSSCKVNRACPLDLRQPSEVVKACHNAAAPSPSCCSSLNSYIGGIKKQMLITNKQAIVCSTILALTLQKAGVTKNLYELCDTVLKDFSLQVTAMRHQGCLLRSLPADIVFNNESGYSFTCDLRDNIGAPWPTSSSVSSLSLCAPEMSLPALSVSKNSGNPGYHHNLWESITTIFSVFMISSILYRPHYFG